ncbi:hypothetical protein Q4566_06750 [Tamlana sp. 2_MG-2023]|uniref:hypothetical protein n=1 Tax=unclassified Tamlana TaxID=2614803 RepID=UPI0026E217D3|nr:MULTISPECIES: hypothetical protein [unclassified Tamlana]MDO6759895.1 hypothetical protein [Tamlana sp. 2_MG-2023]MDO6791935.1 hypothetical protein [Tamlana sp. 1_MG-2023]
MKITNKFHAHLNTINNVSKKSILIIATVAFSMLNVNASNEKSTNSTTTEIVEITKKAIVQVFDWEVKTNSGHYSGTALSLESANRMIHLSSHGEVLKDKKITSYLVLKSEANDTSKRNYFWEVETATGNAKGFSSTEAYAHKMIDLVTTNDAVVSKIIVSQPQH